ncbi:conserved hypothetical protein [Pseudomonas sp. 8Z]|uniref:NACHT domain-containing protein n=1 Tax=Pseudomonas sp. 8Z TaxID=2653166 RepID=UPI0012F2CD39|nr:hypothetical protein [Pseudomonas sp. 8Z]VXC21466.1 conserved hypothetical protein [Pseudomonas sp. 8Z]
MTEIGGPTTQAGIRYQDRVAALYLGRMMDPRERPSRERPVEVRIETPDYVDDFVVRLDDGSQRYFQVKLSLQRQGETWKSLWLALYRQLTSGLSPDDRLALVLGEPSQLASDLKALTERTDGADLEEWLERLTTRQRDIKSSIGQVIGVSDSELLLLFNRLDLSIWPSKELERDYVPLWMPSANVPLVRLFDVLAGIAWAGSETRCRFEGAALHDQLRSEWEITIAAPPSWGLETYRAAIVALARIEVPGTDFQQVPDADFLWPRCLRYDRDRRADFDDDLPGWRDFSAAEEVDLRDFPGIDLRAVVVVAGPGFGKSTVVNAIACRTALAGLVPAIISVTKLSDSNLTIAEYLERVINPDFDVKVDWRAAAATGALILLVDGLDEVSSDRRTLVLERFKVYRAAHPGVRWMMTVRDAAALASPDGATMIELAPLRDTDVSQYVAFYRPGELGIAEALLERIESRTDLAHLTRIPIFLSLMLVMRLEGADLRRSDLLDTYIETLFHPAVFKSIESETIDVALLRSVAERAAYDALEADSIGVTNQLFARSVNRIEPTLSADRVREALIRRGVLRRSGLIRLSFPFPIVQEYLASAELLKQSTEKLVQRLGMISKRPWAQAVQFALERHLDPVPFVNHILGVEDDVFHTGLRLLGRCLANGMPASPSQREEIGRRLALIWGGSSWRANKLINGIIVDAFSRPLHGAIRARLGEHRLLYEGSGTIVALNQDAELTLSVLRELLTDDIEHLLNIGELQGEVDRIGTKSFELYIERCKQVTAVEADADSISCLIGHMKIGSIDCDLAHAAANDETLPPHVRLAAWSKSGRKLDDTMTGLVIECIKAEGFHPNASAAQALSSPTVDALTVVQTLGSAEIEVAKAEKILDYLISDWRDEGCPDRVQELLSVEGFSGPLRDLALLYSIGFGNLKALDCLVDRIEELSAELLSATVLQLGHAPERNRVERIVKAIAGRTWSAEDRVSITHAFSTGLTYRVKMIGLRSGTLEPIPFHPGRSAPHELLRTWLAQSDYSVVDHLRIIMDSVRLGVAGASKGLRSALDAALDAGAGDDCNDSSLVGRALEMLHANGEELSADELEQLAKTSSYNLATSAVALISARGTQAEANTLMRLYEEVNSKMLQSMILSYLEPLASRLALRVTRKGHRLSVVSI